MTTKYTFFRAYNVITRWGADMIGPKCAGHRQTTALIGFGGTPTFWWMRFLKKGFYHCVVALGDASNGWVLIDPLAHYTDLILITDGDLKGFLHAHGYRVVEMPIQTPPLHRLKLMPYTCVETAKRFVGITDRRIWTPYQLYRHVLKIGKKSLT